MRAVQLRAVNAGGGVVCERCEVADGPLTRLRGLMGRASLPRGHGMLLRPAPSIHTFFMRFPIDAVFLDASLEVVDVSESLPPWRAAGRRGARSVLELRAGDARRLGVVTGMQLELAPMPATATAGRRDGPDGD